jgi:8-oxo-dGTP pyrophosphatase MutT (NUDIX family)
MRPIPAATVIVQRDDRNGDHEILMVQRNPQLPVQGGAWAFPGGHIDPADHRAGGTLATAAACAVRETAEEVALCLDPTTLRPLARWITPAQVRPRFDTWIFIAPMPGGEIRVDGREIVDFAWHRPAAALEAHHRGEIALPPPTFVMLTRMVEGTECSRIESITALPAVFRPRLFETGAGKYTLFEEDAGYADGDLKRRGVLHRLRLGPGPWRYEFHGESVR